MQGGANRPAPAAGAARPEYFGQGEYPPADRGFDRGARPDDGALTRERDAALVELGGLRRTLDDAALILARHERTMQSDELASWRNIKSYIQANQLTETSTSAGFQERVEAEIRAATKELKQSFRIIQDKNEDGIGGTDGGFLMKQLEDAERNITRMICTLMSQAELGRSVVIRAPSDASQARSRNNPGVVAGLQRQSDVTGPDLDNDFLDVKRNLNRALEEVHIEGGYEDMSGDIRLEDFEHLLTSRIPIDGSHSRDPLSAHKLSKDSSNQEYIDGLLQRIDILEKSLRQLPKSSQSYPEANREVEVLKNQLNSQDKELRALRRMNEDLQTEVDKLRRAALSNQGQRFDGSQLLKPHIFN